MFFHPFSIWLDNNLHMSLYHYATPISSSSPLLVESIVVARETKFVSKNLEQFNGNHKTQCCFMALYIQTRKPVPMNFVFVQLNPKNAIHLWTQQLNFDQCVRIFCKSVLTRKTTKLSIFETAFEHTFLNLLAVGSLLFTWINIPRIAATQIDM